MEWPSSGILGVYVEIYLSALPINITHCFFSTTHAFSATGVPSHVTQTAELLPSQPGLFLLWACLKANSLP